MKNYHCCLVVVCFFTVAFDRASLVPKKGTAEYVDFISGEYKLLSFLKDPISEETVMTLYDIKAKLKFPIRHKFERTAPLTLATKDVYIVVDEVRHNDPTERKVYITYFGIGEGGRHIWSYFECVYVPRKVESESTRKPKSSGIIISITCASHRFLFCSYESGEVLMPVASEEIIAKYPITTSP